MKAGISIRDITPKGVVKLGGYPEPADRCGLHTHDPLYSSAYYLQSDGKEFLLFCNDIIYFNNKDSQDIRRQLAEATGIPYDHILLSATHTHSGPQYGEVNGVDPYPEWLAYATKLLIENAKEAMANTFDAKIGYAIDICGKDNGIGGNRHSIDGPCDPRTTVMAIKDMDDKLRGLIVNYSLHPTVIHAESYNYSADFVWGLRTYFTTNYPDAILGFNMGCSGDQSTRFFRHGQTWEEAMRIGSLIGASAHKALLSIVDYDENPVLATASNFIVPPVKTIPSVEEATATWEKAKKDYDDLVASGAPYTECRSMECTLIGTLMMRRKAIRVANEGVDAVMSYGLPVELRAFRIGKAVFACVSCECFIEIGLQIKAQSPFEYTFISTLTGGDGIGYLVTDKAFDEYCYEANETSFYYGAAKMVAEESLKLVNFLK